MVDEWNRLYPVGIDFEIVNFQTGIVEKKVDEFTANVVQAILIVLAFMLVLLGPRTGLVVASLVPAAILATLVAMKFLNLSLVRGPRRQHSYAWTPNRGDGRRVEPLVSGRDRFRDRQLPDRHRREEGG